MSPWVYLFSKFTSEALLFEGAALALMIASYAGLWVLRRRRIGEEEITIKAGVVRNYLGMLISDAESMRRQLFAILQGEGMPPPHDLPSPGAGPSLAGIVAPTLSASLAGMSVDDPALKEKLVQIETQMATQAQALNAITQEKTRLEKELGQAKSGGGGAATGGGDTKALQDKIAELEGRLAEYSVIEDDLANLKRLQQENAQLKTQLSKAGGAPADAVPLAAAAAAEAVTVVAAANESPTDAAATEAVAELPAAEAPAAEVAQMATADAPPPAEAAVDPLAALGDPATAAVPAMAEAEPVAAAAPSTDAPPAANVGGSDADLVAEFEKMLNG